MSMEPKVSVIVPVFNSVKTVAASLGSLFTQTLREIEVIAVNDASTDESGRVLDQMASVECRLKVIHLPENLGVHEARAAGLRASTAPWIGFLDADDYARSEMFVTLYKAGEENAVDIVICGVDQVTPKRTVLGSKVRFPENQTITDDVFETFCRIGFGTGALWNKLYRRELLLPHGTKAFFWRQDATEDTLVNLGCFLDAQSAVLVAESLYEYVLHPTSATQEANQARSFTRIMRAYAVAVDTYGAHGRQVLDGITELYSRQLNYDCYRVEKFEDLVAYEPQLSEAVCLLAERHPLGLAALANRLYASTGHEESAGPALKAWFTLSAKLPGLCAKAFLRKITTVGK